MELKKALVIENANLNAIFGNGAFLKQEERQKWEDNKPVDGEFDTYVILALPSIGQNLDIKVKEPLPKDINVFDKVGFDELKLTIGSRKGVYERSGEYKSTASLNISAEANKCFKAMK